MRKLYYYCKSLMEFQKLLEFPLKINCKTTKILAIHMSPFKTWLYAIRDLVSKKNAYFVLSKQSIISILQQLLLKGLYSFEEKLNYEYNFVHYFLKPTTIKKLLNMLDTVFESFSKPLKISMTCVYIMRIKSTMNFLKT